nr:uncharacterized protein LOC128691885 [Cherax quadricarinatus]
MIFPDFENTKDEIKSLLEVYEENLTAYKAEADNITSSLTTRLDDLKNGFEAKLNVQQELQTLQQEEITESNSEVASITAQVSSLKTDIGSISTKVDSLSTQVNSLSTQVNSLSTQVGDLNTRVNSLNTKVNSFSTQISSLTTKVSSISTRVDSFPSQIADLERKTKVNSLLSQHTVWHTSTLTCSGNQELTSNSGAITVVNSGNYVDNVECSWKITLPEGKKILLKWSHFELEYNMTVLTTT